MKDKINIVQFLKDCPKGMELDCTMYEDVYFDYVDKLNIIHCYIKNEGFKTSITFNQHGTPNSMIKSKCVIFPKGKTTWEGFQTPFKDGDIAISESGDWIGIVNSLFGGNDCYEVYVVFENFGKYSIIHKDAQVTLSRLATEEEKQKLFDAIKANGYKWNAETKTLESLIVPKFKVGDKVKLKLKPNYVYTIHSLTWDDNKQLAYRFLPNNDKHLRLVSLKAQDDYELILNKFDITTLVPFESKVLVRAADNQFWRPAIWGVKHLDWDFCCVIGGEMWEQCIPYEGNEHLRGVADDCDEYYKYWE